MQTVNRGPILIADITGYSRFLNESELAHAGETLATLLELLVEETRPPLVVSKLEGDAVLSYGLEESTLRGQAFVETIGACYIEFRRALELMVLNTTCTCNACANISSLDLKFLIHHGEFIFGESAGRTELHGPDVNLVHRLLKNSVTENSGVTAYAMYTRQAVDALDLGAVTTGMLEHSEEYEDVGVVTGRVEDLHPVWEAARKRDASAFDETDETLDASIHIALPLEVVWAHLIDPEYRKTLWDSDRQEIVGAREGRTGSGSAYECYHGGTQVTHLIIEWKPLERVIARFDDRFLGAAVTLTFAYELAREEGGTRLTQRWLLPEGSEWIRRLLMSKVGTKVMAPRQQQKWLHLLEAFRDRIEQEHQTAADSG